MGADSELVWASGLWKGREHGGAAAPAPGEVLLLRTLLTKRRAFGGPLPAAAVLLAAALSLAGLGCHATRADASSDAASAEAVDCSELERELQLEGRLLTREEKRALIEEALYESLGRFQHCFDDVNESGGAAGGGAGGASGASAAGGAAAGGADSVASRAVSGTEAPGEVSDPSGSTSTSQSAAGSGTQGAKQQAGGAQAETQVSTASAGDRQRRVQSGGGRVPQDIPPADNDSVLEAQIRQAAINEPDPQKRERLWNEYRKYKGLPPTDFDPLEEQEDEQPNVN